MNIVSIFALAAATVVIILFLKPKNGEIALMLGIAASVLILISLLNSFGSIISQINSIIAAADINTNYIVILLKVVGICLITEFAVNTCRDAGSQSLAGNVSLAGKIMVTVTALPLYVEILNTVLALLKR